MDGKVQLRWGWLVAAVLGAVAMGFVLAYVSLPAEGPVSRAYQTKFYVTSGGDKAVVASGGEIEVQSGGILDLQSGASITGTAGFDLNGGTLTIDADGDTTLVSSDDDIISMTIGAATGDFKVLTGNLAVGSGTAGQTHNGEDLYVTGLFELDGVAYLDGGADLNGQTFTVDADADTTIVASDDDIISVTLGAATGDFKVLTGNLAVGDGGAGETHDGEDLYVEGIVEVDGAAYFDGAVDMDSTLAVGTATTLESTLSVSDQITATTNVENFGLPSVLSATVEFTSTGALWTCGATEIWFVHAVYCNVTTNFDSGGSNDSTVQLGDTNDPNGFLDLADAELQAADTEMTGAPAGWQGFGSTDTVGAYLAQGLGFVYTNDSIDVATGGTGADAGEATCYIVYTRIR